MKLPKLAKAQSRVLFMPHTIPVATDVAHSIDRSASKTAILFSVSHKSGNHVVRGICPFYNRMRGCKYLGNATTFQYKIGGGRAMSEWQKRIPTRSGEVDVAVFENLTPGWNLPEATRLIQWVRDPAQMIVSAYWYHRDYVYEKWNLLPMQSHSCPEADHEIVYEACTTNCSTNCTHYHTPKCTYHALMNGLDEQTGVAIEAVQSRKQVGNMLMNMKRWLHVPNVLHLSIDHLRVNKTQTLYCIHRWLGLGDKDFRALTQAQYDQVHKLGVGTRDSNYARVLGHGRKASRDAASLEAFLLQHPSWGAQLKDIRRAFEAVFERQERMFQCPHVQLSQ